MDSVNACDDKMIRAKAKAMIVKVKKGSVDRPAIPAEIASSSTEIITDNEQETEESNDVNQKVRKMLRIIVIIGLDQKRKKIFGVLLPIQKKIWKHMWIKRRKLR